MPLDRQSDRLADIERDEYTIYVCDVCGQDADHADYPICPNCQSDRSLELVKVVRADAYQGAVEKNARLLAAVGEANAEQRAATLEAERLRAELRHLTEAGGR